MGTLITKILAETCLPANYLDLEVTGCSFMENQDKTADIFKDLRKQVVPLAIDDFGTEYSSLILENYTINQGENDIRMNKVQEK